MHALCRLEFYFNIHCAIHPFQTTSLQAHKGDPVKAAQAAVLSMQSFSKFLHSRGQHLSQTPEFLPFYALPFIPSPIDHPSFKLLFEKTWVSNLRNKLKIFLESALGEYIHIFIIHRVYSSLSTAFQRSTAIVGLRYTSLSKMKIVKGRL